MVGRGFHSSAAALGRPWKRRDSRPVIHAAQKPAERADIDFSNLGLTYELKETPKFVIERHAWSPQPTERPQLPFMVDRTEVGLSLPVYTDLKDGDTRVITIIRKIRGDVLVLKAEVEKVVGREVELRPGKIVIEGNFHRRIKVWLTGLGF
jgi:hypothetical protein